jgi:hypothetical protein
MSKSQTNKDGAKKKPARTMQEKKDAKREKKNGANKPVTLTELKG